MTIRSGSHLNMNSYSVMCHLLMVCTPYTDAHKSLNFMEKQNRNSIYINLDELLQHHKLPFQLNTSLIHLPQVIKL